MTLSNHCIIDTNTLIYHLNNALQNAGEQLLERAIENNAHIFVITRIELLGWQKHTPTSLKQIKLLLGLLTEQSLTEEIVSICIELRQQRILKIPDAIIAATALHLNLPLVTHNISDFSRVPKLKLIDPLSLR